jgi:hypothetical protein
MTVGRIGKALFGNAGHKILSLLLAASLWIIVQHGRYQEVDFILPLELVDIPHALVLSGEPKSVHVRVRASKEVAQSLTAQLFHASLSMRKAVTGENLFRLSTSSVAAPPGATVISVSPDFVSATFSYHRLIPVVPLFTGSAAPGYRVTGYRVSPERVDVIGRRESDVTSIRQAVTTPIPLAGSDKGFTVTTSLSALHSGMRYVGEPTVRVTVTIDGEEEH